MIVAKVKEEIALWSLAGAKAISIIMPLEKFLFVKGLTFWLSLSF
jgi:hypothetical protein